MFEEDDSIEAVAKRLKAARLALGYDSKRDYCLRAGINEQVYGPFENGRRPISLEAAKRLRKTYGLSLEFIYFGNVLDLPTRISQRL